jgi:competence ComEA-like helix-hairpin-helix protein
MSVFVLASPFWPTHARCSQPWSDLTIRPLPDTSFASVETDKNGKKSRHLPYRDKNGLIDMNQLIYCLGTFGEESWVEPKNKEIAKRHLEEHYHRLKAKQLKDEMIDPININTADLEELVRLPNIGPVSAVRICRFRKTHGLFQTIEGIKKVEGIGASTFAGIRYYVVVQD